MAGRRAEARSVLLTQHFSLVRVLEGHHTTMAGRLFLVDRILRRLLLVDRVAPILPSQI